MNIIIDVIITAIVETCKNYRRIAIILEQSTSYSCSYVKFRSIFFILYMCHFYLNRYHTIVMVLNIIFIRLNFRRCDIYFDCC